MKPRKLLDRIEAGSYKNIAFRDFVALVEALGFQPERTNGSHRIFRHPVIHEKLNLQPRGNVAKTYQVQQLRILVREYDLHLIKD